MITGHEIYEIIVAMVPLYVAMFLSYGSVRWWKIFTPDQCSGINRFVAVFAVPFLSFHYISLNNPYTMNFRFLAADILQKIIILIVLGLWAKFTKSGSFEWMITIFSLSTLPNALVVGIPLLNAFYGDLAVSLMVQLVVLQCIIWYNLLIFFFEFRGAKMLIMEKIPVSGADIASIKVDSDVVSLDDQDCLETNAEIGEDGKLHVNIKKSNASRRLMGFGSLSGAEMYSISSSAMQTPRASNCNESDFYSIVGFPGCGLLNFRPVVDLYSVPSSSGLAPGPSNFKDDFQKHSSATKGEQPTKILRSQPRLQQSSRWRSSRSKYEVNMFVRSSSAPVVSKGNRVHTELHTSTKEAARQDQRGDGEVQTMFVSDHTRNGKIREIEESRCEIRGDDNNRIKLGLDSVAWQQPNRLVAVPDEGTRKQMPSTLVMSRLIMTMAWRKLIRNPNTYASTIGLIWALVSFRWHAGLPKIIAHSITLISNTGLGMSMFSLGLFMALQPKFIACGRSKATLAMLVKFALGPASMAVTSVIMRLRGNLFHISILQATISLGIVPFVFAKEYNVHPKIVSTAVIFGMLIGVPITICYYILLGLKN